MSSDTPRSIDRTPRQVAGPGVGDRPDTARRDPRPLADPGDAGERYGGDEVDEVDEVDVRDPDVTPVDEVDVRDPDVTPVDDGDPEVVPSGDRSPADAALATDPAVPDPDTEPDSDRVPKAGVPAPPDPRAGTGFDPDTAPDRDRVPEAGVPAQPDPRAGSFDPEAATEPARVPEAATGLEPDRDRAAEVDPQLEAGTEPDADTGTGPGRFLTDPASLRERWERVQVGFVDDPRRAVEEAHAMVSAAVAELQAEIDRQRDELGRSWRDDAASTDALRSAFRGYRDLFDRVLSV